MAAFTELSLFSGAGGGLLATKHLLGWHTVCYVEWDKYAVKVLKARIADGMLDNAPIWDNAFTFNGRPWAGLVDVITAGFPCQPFSRAGNMLAENDPRNGWPATIRIIGEVRPQFAFLENVPDILSFPYFGTILGDLAALGYDAKWEIVSACSIGAPHTRERLFIVAYANGIRTTGGGIGGNGSASSTERETQKRRKNRFANSRLGKAQIWAEHEADIVRMADGMGSKMDRVRAIGNGQVPAVVAEAWRRLTP
jgi:DNA (cytosine-5)-methyltransferase 1